MVGFSCLNLKHSVRSKRIYGEGLIKNHYRHREVIMEEQAFRQAVEDHRDVVFRIALTYLRDCADADDVPRMSFLSCLKAMDILRVGSIFAAGLSGSRSMNVNRSFESHGGAWRILRTWPIRFRRRRMRPRRSCQTLCDFRSDSASPSCSITIWAFRPQRLPSYCMCQPRPFERV